MNSQVCPICEKTVSNLIQHLVLVHNIRSPEELRQYVDTPLRKPLEAGPQRDIGINWDVEFYKTLTQLGSEKRVIFIEEELDELINIVDRVTNDMLLDQCRVMLSNMANYNEAILNKKSTLLRKLG